MNMVFAAAVFSAFAAAATARPCAKVQEPFSFRKNLESPHVANRRDVSLKPAADEFVFVDGCAVPDGDFADYLKVSMGVDAKVGENGVVQIKFDRSLEERESRIETTDMGVAITAFDDRAARRALYHLEDLMNLRRAPFLKKVTQRRRAVFSPRMTHSGWALDKFPDGHLAQIAHYGFDAILIFVEGIDRTKGGQKHDIADIIRRAKKHGLDTYIYSYITAFAHPDDPGSQKVFNDTYGRVAAAYPDAKGIVFVGESAEFPSKDERTSGMSAKETRKRGDKRPAAGRFPSRDYPDWINAVKRTLHAHSPDMEFVFWTYNWGGAKKDLRLAFIQALPKDVTLMATFEMYEGHYKHNAMYARIDDYSLCVPGPGKYFSSEAEEAKRQGLRLYTMSNTGGLTWDFGTVPYLPMPYQWKKRWDALRTANREWGLAGLMENHHYGWYPSFVAELAKEAFTEGGIPFERHIRMIAERDYGKDNADAALQAWKLWSLAIEDYVATAANQYGPFRIGPAYPFNALRERIDNATVAWPKDALNSRFICRQNYLERNFQNTGVRVPCHIPGVRKELELLEGMEAKFRKGSELFAGMGTPMAREMADFGEYLMRTVITAANVKRGAIAETIALDAERPESERAAAKEEVEKLACAEYANAEAAIPLLERNSRLGWEPTMGYAGGADMIRVKLERMKKRYRMAYIR